MDWAIKHAPQSPQEYAGLKSSVKIISNFLDRWAERNQLKNGLILYGESGNGKTSLVYSISKVHNLNIIEVNASNKRNLTDLRRLQSISGTNSFDDKTTIILLDEADGIKAWKPIETLLKNTQCPIIFTCNYIDKIPYEVSKDCINVEIIYPTDTSIIRRLKEILKYENKKVSDKHLKKIVSVCNSMRSAILTLQRCVTSNDFRRIVPQDVDYGETEQIRRLFAGKDVELTLDSRTVRKWAIANDVPIHNLDKISKLAREVPDGGLILGEYVKTLRGKIIKLKSPYYRKYIKKKKVEVKDEDDDYIEYKSPAKKVSVIVKKQLSERNTFEDDELW